MATEQNTIQVRRSAEIRTTFSTRFLLHELQDAACKCDDAEFAKFQQKSLRHLLPGFDPKVLSVCVQQISQDGVFLAAESFRSVNIDPSAVLLYREVHCDDDVFPHSWANPGTAVFNTDFMSLDEWNDTRFYREFKSPLGLYHAVLLTYQLPYATEKFMKFVYDSGAGKTFCSKLTKDEIEYVTMPFMYAWLYKFGYIDRSSFSRILNLLTNITPVQLFLLRELVNIPVYQNKSVAQKFKISGRVVNNYFANIYGQISHLLPDRPSLDARAAPLVDLVRHFSFLNLAGSPVIARTAGFDE
ncbi:MAG: hypothetical protein GY948_18280 [Alphaproteobacteria bacterium]|nr:hypothetical protein [Alphaproteobacteria bacterium]